MRILTVLSGILLVATGVFAIANQGVSFLSIAFIISISMIFAGTVQASGYIYGRYTSKDEILIDMTSPDVPPIKIESRAQKNTHGWIMIDAAVTFVLGLLVLSNQLKAEIAVVSVFGMWMLTGGVRRIVTSSYIDRIGKARNYYWTLGTGIINAAAGIYAFYNSNLFQLPVATLLGGFFVLQGISTLELGIHMPHRHKTNKLLSDIENGIQRTLIEFNLLKREDLIEYARAHQYQIDEDATKESILQAIKSEIDRKKGK